MISKKTFFYLSNRRSNFSWELPKRKELSHSLTHKRNIDTVCLEIASLLKQWEKVKENE
jgi:hypothetical protein